MHKYLKQRLLATGLGLTAFGQSLLPLPVLAQALTPAGTQIQNRATGTYVDPTTGQTINVTSNQVTVTVAKVAGITAIPAGIIDTNGGSISTGDTLHFNFLVTNSGNAPTNIHFPGTTDMVSQGFNITGYQLDLNNDGDFDDANEAVQTGSFTTTTPISAGASVRVRVIGTVTAFNAGDVVSVRIGDTPPDNNSPDTQNQPSTGGGQDLRTDNTGLDAPVNGEREASAIQSTTVAIAVRNEALATILKERTAYNNNNTPTTLNDDIITYGLALRVENNPGNIPGVTPAGLAPTVNINIDGQNRNVILISDAIPAGTQLTGTPTAPTGWRVVYTTTPTSTFATGATWTTSNPGTGVTRIGFVYDPDNDLATASPPIAAGQTITGFSFQVVTSGLTASGGTIANIAQVFGRTDGTNREVYDESGDQRPSNYNDDGTPNSQDDPNTPGREDVNNGVANPAVQGTDNNNNNTGTGPGGEVNVFVISPPGTILNGPNNQPGAIGPTNNQDDFTNRSTNVPAGQAPGSTFNPAPVVFNNTLQNPASNTTNLDTVRILPLPPSVSGQPDTDIPAGTQVTITVGSQSATYEWNGTQYNPTSVTSILLNGIGPGTSINYTVTVDLPNNTQLSADRFDANGQARAGFNIPIVAFVDNDNNGQFNPANDPIYNITINRVYTGYVKLRKRSQIIRNGTPVTGLDSSNKDVRPGDIIRYVIEYVNFSLPNAGTGNVVLDATDLQIVEDGNAPPNNWAGATFHVNESTTVDGAPLNTFASQGTILFNGAAIADPATGTAVNVYQNNVGTIPPSANPSEYQGFFRFHRQVR
ncbi:MAG: hypothetical protein RMI92_01795 [Geminocystis sp.]|nr:hypothetical protein [Geminocystis sp.]